jgi:hypothetical protein
MDYLNNLNARIDNVLSDVYFGSTSILPTPPKMFKPPNIDNCNIEYVWLFIGVLIGVIFCYLIYFYMDNQEREDDIL